MLFNGNPDLSLVYIHKFKSNKVNNDEIYNALLKILEFFNIEFNNNDVIGIKPNLCDLRPYYQGSTTDPRIVQQLIRIINEKAPDAKIIIIESSHPIAKASEEFEILGFKELSGKNLEFVDLTFDKKTQVSVNGRVIERYNMPETMMKITKLINIPVLKTHLQHKITVSMKNLFGLYAPRFRKRMHSILDETLFDLYEMHPPTINIVDGIIGMEGAGPSDGTPIKTDLLIAGTDAIAVDYVSAKIMGFNPKRVPIIKWAINKEGYDTHKIKIINFEKKIQQRFKFVPKYAYLGKRLALSLKRIGRKIDNMFSGISSFIDELSLGLVVLIKGYFISTDFGMYRRSDALRYGKGLLLRPIYSFKFKNLKRWKKIKLIIFLLLFVLLFLSSYKYLNGFFLKK